LRACGTSSVVADDLVLLASALPQNRTALLYMSRGQIDGGLPFGDGLFCLGGAGARLYHFHAANSGPAGSLSAGPGLVAYTHAHFANDGHIAPGDTWYFQLLVRDPPGPCGTAFNSSNALAVTFLP
jgi:hypothetical protein